MPIKFDLSREWTCPSWETVLTLAERLGGASPWGNSRWGDLRRCPFLYWWKHVRRMTEKDPSEALEIGGLYHEARARYYQTYLRHEDELPGDELDRACVEAGHEIIERASEVTPYVSSMARKLFESWLVKYGPGMPLDDRDKVYDVECLLEVDSPFPYSARIDAWLMTDYGPVIMEIKTAARRDGRLITSYGMDPQFIGHAYLWRKTMQKKWGPLHGYYIDLATKTDPVGVTREAIEVSNKQIVQWEKSMQHWNLLRHQFEVTKSWPKNYGYQCRFCSLFRYCASGNSDPTGWVRRAK